MRSSWQGSNGLKHGLYWSWNVEFHVIRVMSCKTHGENQSRELETASAHKSAKTHAGSVLVTRDLDLWPFEPKQMDGTLLGAAF